MLKFNYSHVEKESKLQEWSCSLVQIAVTLYKVFFVSLENFKLWKLPSHTISNLWEYWYVPQVVTSIVSVLTFEEAGISLIHLACMVAVSSKISPLLIVSFAISNVGKLPLWTQKKICYKSYPSVSCIHTNYSVQNYLHTNQ